MIISFNIFDDIGSDNPDYAFNETDHKSLKSKLRELTGGWGKAHKERKPDENFSIFDAIGRFWYTLFIIYFIQEKK